jgi:hypothetical protein
MQPFPSSYDTLNLYVEPVLYPVSDKHSICIFKLKLKKWMLTHRWFFRYAANNCPVHPQPDEHTVHLMSSTVSPLSFLQPITFFLPATLTRRFPRGRLVRCSPHSLAQLQLESFPRLLLVFSDDELCFPR